MITEALIFSLITMFAFGIANTSAKKMVEIFGPVDSIVVRNVVVVVLLALVVWYMDIQLVWNPAYLALGALLAFGGFIGFAFLMAALNRGKVGIVIPITAGRIVPMALIGFLFLGDAVTFEKVIMVVMVLAGLVLASVNFKDFRASDIFSWKSGVPLALLAALSWGVAHPFFKLPTEVLGGIWYALIIEVVILVCAVIYMLVLGRRRRFLAIFRSGTMWQPMVLMAVLVTAVFTAIADVFLNLAFATGEISLASAVTASSPLVSLVLAAIFFNERLTFQQYVGVALVIVGIVVPSLL